MDLPHGGGEIRETLREFDDCVVRSPERIHPAPPANEDDVRHTLSSPSAWA